MLCLLLLIELLETLGDTGAELYVVSANPMSVNINHYGTHGRRDGVLGIKVRQHHVVRQPLVGHSTQHFTFVLEAKLAVAGTSHDELVALGDRSGREHGLQGLERGGDVLVVSRGEETLLALDLLAREEGTRESVTEVGEVGVAEGDWGVLVIGFSIVWEWSLPLLLLAPPLSPSSYTHQCGQPRQLANPAEPGSFPLPPDP